MLYKLAEWEQDGELKAVLFDTETGCFSSVEAHEGQRKPTKEVVEKATSMLADEIYKRLVEFHRKAIEDPTHVNKYDLVMMRESGEHHHKNGVVIHYREGQKGYVIWENTCEGKSRIGVKLPATGTVFVGIDKIKLNKETPTEEMLRDQSRRLAEQYGFSRLFGAALDWRNYAQEVMRVRNRRD